MISCPNDLFKKMSDSRGSWFTAVSSEEKDFLNEALSMDLDFTGLYLVSIPAITEGALNDWEFFEYWLEDINPKVSLDDFNLDGYDLYSEGCPKPSLLIGCENTIKQKIVHILRDKPQDDAGLACVQIHANDKTLWLLYEDIDSWGLGYGDTVMVVADLEELTEKNGFYAL